MVAFLLPNAHLKKRTFGEKKTVSPYAMTHRGKLPQPKTLASEGYSWNYKAKSKILQEFMGGGSTYEIGTFLILSLFKWIIQLALPSRMRHQDTGERARKATFTPVLVRASRSALSSSKVESIDMFLSMDGCRTTSVESFMENGKPKFKQKLLQTHSCATETRQNESTSSIG